MQYFELVVSVILKKDIPFASSYEFISNLISRAMFDDPRFKDVKDIDDIPSHLLDEIAHFFKEYKRLENKETEVLGWENADIAKEEINRSIELYKY